MRDRHIPRLCRECRAPMARQEDKCWRCDVDWAPEAQPPTKLRLIPTGAADAATPIAAEARAATLPTTNARR